jgi:hypothetical protein
MARATVLEGLSSQVEAHKSNPLLVLRGQGSSARLCFHLLTSTMIIINIVFNQMSTL